MYLAPLNYDRFFKKVFSHTHIAKAFLEDFLGETIEEIELLERTHLLTNSAMKIEVDFRCKIKGSHYKKEVVFKEVIRLILKKSLDINDLEYIETEDEHAKMVERTLEGVRQDAFKEGVEKGEQIGLEKAISKLYKKGKNAGEIADLLDISEEEVRSVLQKLKL